MKIKTFFKKISLAVTNLAKRKFLYVYLRMKEKFLEERSQE